MEQTVQKREAPESASITITTRAASAIKKQIEKRGIPNTALRLGIRGGGCSGFSYVIEFHDGPPRARDRVFDVPAEDGTIVRVVADPKSLVYLNGMTLEWEATLLQQGFKFQNPNEKTSCGCGHSFTADISMDPFQTLGLEPAYAIDLAAVEKRHRELSRTLHPDRYVGGSPTERRTALTKAADVNEAWRIVRDPIRRAEALLLLRGVPVGEDKEPKPSPDLLMEMMEARESLAEARDEKEKLAPLVASMQERMKCVEDNLAGALVRKANDEALALLGELRFVHRLLSEAEDAL